MIGALMTLAMAAQLPPEHLPMPSLMPDRYSIECTPTAATGFVFEAGKWKLFSPPLKPRAWTTYDDCYGQFVDRELVRQGGAYVRGVCIGYQSTGSQARTACQENVFVNDFGRSETILSCRGVLLNIKAQIGDGRAEYRLASVDSGFRQVGQPEDDPKGPPFDGNRSFVEYGTCVVKT